MPRCVQWDTPAKLLSENNVEPVFSNNQAFRKGDAKTLYTFQVELLS
jgi:hypothetical protein